jgi:hypothetical protein
MRRATTVELLIPVTSHCGNYKTGIGYKAPVAQEGAKGQLFLLVFVSSGLEVLVWAYAPFTIDDAGTDVP